MTKITRTDDFCLDNILIHHIQMVTEAHKRKDYKDYQFEKRWLEKYMHYASSHEFDLWPYFIMEELQGDDIMLGFYD